MTERWFCGSEPARIVEGQPEGGYTPVAADVAAHDEYLGLHLSRHAAGQVIALLAGSCLTVAERR
jgi:hypothetical protein